MSWKMWPSDIVYSQGSISSKFQGGGSLIDTFENLVQDAMSVDDFQPIKVAMHKNEWWAFEGNRRLFLFKKLQEAGLLTSPITVEKFWGWKNITAGPNNTEITVRGYPHIEDVMDDIVQSWRAYKHNSLEELIHGFVCMNCGGYATDSDSNSEYEYSYW